MPNLKIKDKRVLSIQDLSCFGKCSLSVALPIIAACGIEVDIIPSAILSTHTGGFKNNIFIDLTDYIMDIKNHWYKEGIFFDILYSAYLGNKKQISYVSNICDNLLYKNAIKIIDPVMADNGKLYKGFDISYIEEIKKLCKKADIILPNITEACFLTGIEYQNRYDIAYIENILKKLENLTSATVILKGIHIDNNMIMVAIKDKNNLNFVEGKFINKTFNGTGDIFASAFIGCFLNNKGLKESVKISMDFVLESIENTLDDEAHWYGVKFEKAIKNLINKVYNK